MSKISLIDTHAHYNNVTMTDLNKKIDIANKNEDVSKIINVGLEYKTSEETIKIALINDKFYATLGIHPLYNGNVDDLEILYNKYDNTKIIGLGETGIDTNGDIDLEIKKFISSIKLSNKLKLPLIIHSNTTKSSNIYANKLCIEILKKYKPINGFVFHCFQPDIDILNEIIKLNGYISIGSKILKPNAKKSLEVVSLVPIDKLLIETDYSFLTDTPNISGIETFNKICSIKNKDKNHMMNQLNENAKRLFYKLK